ncbi:MAG: hypothetical protein DHS20C10_00830 [marine bacterium B5-7]|nr:MAG: hypothetical protein DHS20C10_00830 [marine bacterium B5-7]
MSDKEAFHIKPPTPKPTHINKTVIVLLVGLAALVFSVVLITAFRAPSHHSHTKNAWHDNNTPEKSAVIEQLPNDYQHISPQPSGDSAAMRAMRAQQAALAKQLAALQEKLQHQPVHSQADKQAATSVMFFPGIQPPSKKIKTSNTAAASDKKDKASDEGKHSKHTRVNRYVQQNMQKQKLAFLQESDDEDTKNIYNTHHLETPLSPDEIQAGTIIPAILITAVNTSLPGEIVSQVNEDLYDTVTGNTLLIPKGSRLVGQYDSQVAYGQTRVLIVFKRIIMPNGESILLSNAQGTDLFGQSGMQGSVNNHWGRVMGAAVLSSVLSLGTGAVSDNSYGNDNNFYRSSGQGAAIGVASNVSQVGQQLTDRAINIQPTLVIPAGYAFNIIVNKDMVLTPYLNALASA